MKPWKAKQNYIAPFKPCSNGIFSQFSAESIIEFHLSETVFRKLPRSIDKKSKFRIVQCKTQRIFFSLTKNRTVLNKNEKVSLNKNCLSRNENKKARKKVIMRKKKCL